MCRMSRLSNCVADMEEEHAEDERADQHVERDAQLDHQRHAVGRAGGGEEQAVLHRQEADHLRHRLAPRDHHQERQQHARHRDAERRAREGARHLRDRGGQREREDHQADADQHRGRNVDQGLDVPAHVQPVDQAVQYPRDQHHLEQQRERGRGIQMTLAGCVGHDQRRGGKRGALPGEQLDQRQDAPLRQHREREQQQERREQVDELAGERLIHGVLSRASGSGSACRARRAGTRWTGTRARGTGASWRAASRAARARRPASASFAASAANASGSAPQSPASAMPQGTNSAMPMVM